MKIMIINPNSDEAMSTQILKSARSVCSGDTYVDCFSTPGAPRFIENYEDAIYCGRGMLQLMAEKEKEYDAFIVACHDDVNLDAVREQTEKIVLGIGETSLKVASMLGHKFSVIQTTDHSVPMKEDVVAKYGLERFLASIVAVDDREDVDLVERVIAAAEKAVHEDGAEVVVLGCAGLTGIQDKVEKRISVPVVDGVTCAVKLAEALVASGLKMSKLRKYRPLK